VTLKTRLGVRQGHWKCHHSIERIWRTFYSKYGYISYRLRCRKISQPWNHGQRSTKVMENCTIRYTRYSLLLVFYSNFVPKTPHFFEIFDFKNAVTLKIWLGVRRGNWKYHHLIQCTFRSYHMGLCRTVSKIDWDFSRKSQHFPTSFVFLPPLKGFPNFPLEFGIGAGITILEWWGYRLDKKFEDIFSCLDRNHRMHERDRQTNRLRPGHSKYRAYA